MCTAAVGKGARTGVLHWVCYQRESNFELPLKCEILSWRKILESLSSAAERIEFHLVQPQGKGKNPGPTDIRSKISNEFCILALTELQKLWLCARVAAKPVKNYLWVVSPLPLQIPIITMEKGFLKDQKTKLKMLWT